MAVQQHRGEGGLSSKPPRCADAVFEGLDRGKLSGFDRWETRQRSPGPGAQGSRGEDHRCELQRLQAAIARQSRAVTIGRPKYYRPVPCAQKSECRRLHRHRHPRRFEEKRLLRRNGTQIRKALINADFECSESCMGVVAGLVPAPPIWTTKAARRSI